MPSAKYLGLRGPALSTLVSGICGLCFLCFGYAQGVMGGLLTVGAFLDRFPLLDTINNNTLYHAQVQGAVVGTWNIGCLLSAILTIFIGDYLGRRKTLLLGLTIWMVGEIIQCSSYSLAQFIVGRAVAGFGNGFTTATVPAYQAECVKSHRKGTILMISTGAFIALGLALSYWLVFGFSYIVSSSATWRVPIAFQIIFALIALIALLFLPESPRWLILTGREEEALNVLSALNDEDRDGPEIRDEFLQIKDAILVMSQGSTSSMRKNSDRRNLHRVVLAYFVQVFQQMSGINLVLQYLTIILYNQMRYTGWLARLIGACAATEYFLASFIAVIGIDRFWGRRSLMMFGAAGMCICMVLLTILLYLWGVKGVHGTNIAATVFLFAFSTFFAIGWQGMAWLYQVEIVPLRIRGPANALSTSANWLFNSMVVIITPIAFHNISYRTYIIFACTNFAILPLIYFFYPETAYRSLEEVDVLFHLANEAPGNPWLNVVRISKNEPLWFGRRGEIPFNYEKSAWHERYLRMFGASGSTLGEKSNTSNGRSGDGPQSAGLFSSPTSNEQTRDSSGAQTAMSGKSFTYIPPSGATTARQTLDKPPSPPPQRLDSYHSAHDESNWATAHNEPNWAAPNLGPEPSRIPSESSRPESLYTTHTRYSTPHPGRFSNRHRSGSYGQYDPGLPSSPVLDEVGSGGIVRSASGRETYLPDGGGFFGAVDGVGDDGEGERKGSWRRESWRDSLRGGSVDEGSEVGSDDELEKEARRVLGREKRSSAGSGGRVGARGAGRAY